MKPARTSNRSVQAPTRDPQAPVLPWIVRSTDPTATILRLPVLVHLQWHLVQRHMARLIIPRRLTLDPLLNTTRTLLQDRIHTRLGLGGQMRM